jgi:hypothetical protein
MKARLHKNDTKDRQILEEKCGSESRPLLIRKSDEADNLTSEQDKAGGISATKRRSLVGTIATQ